MSARGRSGSYAPFVVAHYCRVVLPYHASMSSVRWNEIQAGGGGAPGALVRFALRFLSVGWAVATCVRHAFLALGLVRVRRLPVPVVSVGNLAVGGTGKTPFTAWLAEGLRARGRHPGILSRGYGPPAAGAEGLSDEGAVLDFLLGGSVPQVEARDRWRGGLALLARNPSTDVILLDDGFQHRRLARDLDVVLLDATNPFGHGHLLPRGRLRELPGALARAGAVVLTRAERVAARDLERIVGDISCHTRAPIAVARTTPSRVVVGGEEHEAAWFGDRPVFAACGIGNPHAFAALLEDLGARPVGHRFLPDHAAPTSFVWDAIREEARAGGAECVVITRKDAVKLETLPPDVAVLDVDLEIVSGEADLWAVVETALGKRND